MDKEQAMKLVRQYKQAISGILNSPIGNNWLTLSGKLWYATLAVSTLIEPVLLEEGDHSPLYQDIMRTGVAI